MTEREDGPALLAARLRVAALEHENARLRSALEVLDHLVGHDLRSPLQAIQSCAELIAIADGPDRRHRLSEHMMRACGRLSDMLTSGRGLAGQAGEAPGWGAVDLAAVAAQAQRDSPDPRRVAVSVEAPAQVLGDASGVALVLDALLANACRHGVGPIDLHVRGGEGGISVRVMDRGEGFFEAHRDALFRPFFSRGPAAGAGVGLARVRAVVEGAGGSVVATLRPGGGAIFGADWPAQLPWLEPRAE